MDLNLFLIFISFLCILNLIIILSLCNFLIKLANSLINFRKELEDYYYLKSTSAKSNQENNQESGLVDL